MEMSKMDICADGGGTRRASMGVKVLGLKMGNFSEKSPKIAIFKLDFESERVEIEFCHNREK